jgi:hypothetical protein
MNPEIANQRLKVGENPLNLITDEIGGGQTNEKMIE